MSHKVGRNEPCPCGGGRKYKQCHGAAAANDEPARGGIASAVERAIRWLLDRHGRATQEAVAELMGRCWPPGPEMDDVKLDRESWERMRTNAMEWLLAEGALTLKAGHAPVQILLLGPRGPGFDPEQRAWIAALGRTPLRLYRITDVVLGEGMTVVDALDATVDPVRVLERSGSRSAQLGDLIGARLIRGVPRPDSSVVLSGAIYPFARAWHGRVLADARACLEKDIEPADLARELSLNIIASWLCQALLPAPVPLLVDSSTGEPLLFVTDHYAVPDPAALREVLRAHAELHDDGDDAWSRLVRDADGADRSHLRVRLLADTGRAQVSCRTQQLADAGRPWFEAQVGAHARHLTREVSDPRSLMGSPATAGDRIAVSSTKAPPGPSRFSPQQMHEVMRDFVHRHYARWSDEPLPMLDGRTPRQALATSSGREQVLGLLRTYESSEAEMARKDGREPVSYDFLWQQVGLLPERSL